LAVPRSVAPRGLPWVTATVALRVTSGPSSSNATRDLAFQPVRSISGIASICRPTGAPDPTSEHGPAVDAWLYVEVGGALEILSHAVRAGVERPILALSTVADIAQTVPVRRHR
jgi:hypothetical protein